MIFNGVGLGQQVINEIVKVSSNRRETEHQISATIALYWNAVTDGSSKPITTGAGLNVSCIIYAL